MPQGRTSPVTWRRPYALYTATWLDIVQQRLSQLLSTKHYWSHSQVGSDNRASFVSNTYVLTSHLMIHHGTSYRTGWHDTSRYILSHWLTCSSIVPCITYLKYTFLNRPCINRSIRYKMTSFVSAIKMNQNKYIDIKSASYLSDFATNDNNWGMNFVYSLTYFWVNLFCLHNFHFYSSFLWYSHIYFSSPPLSTHLL